MAVIEIGIPIEKALSYKRPSGLPKLLQKIQFDFSMNVRSLDNLPIQYVDVDDLDFCDIPDFGYSINNECPDSKTHKVFRNFGLDIYAIVPKDPDTGTGVFATYRYMVNDYPVHMIVSGMEESERNYQAPIKNKVKITYEGKSDIE